MGKGKERVLRGKFCNCVSEEQNVERGRKGFCVKNFVTVFQKGFHKRSRLKRLWIWAYGGIKCIISGLYGGDYGGIKMYQNYFKFMVEIVSILKGVKTFFKFVGKIQKRG